MKRIILCAAFVVMGCRGLGDGPVKTKTDQTTQPPDKAGEDKYPPAPSVGSPLRPLPTVWTQPTDLTSSVGASPLVVAVDNLGEPVPEALLNSLAQQVQLFDTAGKAVAISATLKNASGSTHGETGYRTHELARIEITPTTPLADVWHTLKVNALPAGLAWPTYSTMQALPGGAKGTRFRPGSSPRPSAIRVCAKEGGTNVVIVDWSERVSYPDNIGSMAIVREVSGTPKDCLPDPALVGVGTTPSFRFLCSDLPAAGVLAVDLDRKISSPSGGAATDLVGEVVGDKVRTRASVDKMTIWGDGCRIIRPW